MPARQSQLSVSLQLCRLGRQKVLQSVAENGIAAAPERSGRVSVRVPTDQRSESARGIPLHRCHEMEVCRMLGEDAIRIAIDRGPRLTRRSTLRLRQGLIELMQLRASLVQLEQRRHLAAQNLRYHRDRDVIDGTDLVAAQLVERRYV